MHLIIKNIIITNSYKCGVGLVVEHVLAKDETGVRFSYAAHYVTIEFCGVIGKLLCLCRRIERLFLVEDGKVPATVGRDSLSQIKQ